MADQDFDINIRTVADVTGVRKAADAIAILNEQAKKSQAEAAAAGAAGAGGGGIADIAGHVERGLLRTAVHAIGVGAIFEAINAIKQAAEEINKITDSLDKQGALLVENSRHIIQQSKFAQTDADVLKIAEEAMKNIAEQHKLVEELQKKEISHAEALADSFVNPYGTGGPNQARLDAEKAAALDDEATAKRVGIQSIATAETTKARLATESYSLAVQELNKKLGDEEEKKNAAFLIGDIKGYLEAAEAAKQYTKEIENVKGAHDKLTSKTEKYIEGADPQVKAILANEKAMFEARAGGKEQDAAMYERTALTLRGSARPDQLAEVAKIYSGKEVVDAIKELGRNQRELIDLWK